MKRLFTLFAVIALTSSLITNAAESRLENYVNKKLSPITEKEKAFNEKMEAQQKANEAKQAEYQKQQEARRAELKKQQEARQAAAEKQRQEAKARRQATKDAIQAEKDYWNSLIKK